MNGDKRDPIKVFGGMYSSWIYENPMTGTRGYPAGYKAYQSSGPCADGTTYICLNIYTGTQSCPKGFTPYAWQSLQGFICLSNVY